ncbi:MAG: electron transfer flavoprotein subunit alpha/FixB family protein [Chloroflexota bacterium]|nr:MAG: electron transfer flavoprotein subunit alpha/FixB family protein [Chloroflexota bacterium]
MIIGVVEHDRDKISDLSLQMLTLGNLLAEQLSVPLHALLIGEAGAALARTLGSSGVSVVHIAKNDRLDEYAPQAWAQCVVELVSTTSPEIVLAAGTDRGHEVMAHVAARTDLPLATNCTQVQPGESFEVTRLRWGGSLLEEAQLSGAVKLLTVAPHAIAAQEVPVAAEPGVDMFSPGLADDDFRVRVAGRIEPDRSKISLGDAKVVVGGGRGVGSAEGFEILEEIASMLGGTVGCSRAVTSLGWRPHSDQVGQTGTRIAPDVYIACGISGAIQHMVGCKSAKCLVAINKDPEAPIVAQADYAIIGDLKQVLPALRDAIRNAQNGS